MYLRPAFVETDPARIAALIRANPFGLLVTSGARGMEASHVPFVLEEEGEAPLLSGHLAAGNDQCAAIEAGAEALVVFSGPHAYVSPSWYRSAPAVPTWDYAAVHLSGRLRPGHGASAEASLQALAVADPGGFALAALPAPFRDRMLSGLRPFLLRAERVEAQWKMSQNRSVADRQGVIAGLRGQGDAANAAVAELVAATLPPGA